ncbi:hypothetical protein HPB50_011186 [Hyalomma asiaticum]|uniref:Uncharacterized protein n=1 Tax=Hyalomma asiaticum TaxID=266040 RepID=A0ACB7RYR2_HYAAI|nr:hypothetical protein HPB50_011186 [Hyalomma asiaticum]
MRVHSFRAAAEYFFPDHSSWPTRLSPGYRRRPRDPATREAPPVGGKRASLSPSDIKDSAKANKVESAPFQRSSRQSSSLDGLLGSAAPSPPTMTLTRTPPRGHVLRGSWPCRAT